MTRRTTSEPYWAYFIIAVAAFTGISSYMTLRRLQDELFKSVIGEG